ncbi:Protein of unknown function [Pyronema omphalodes CBS 100304]|uniref:Uncharacterized protein n=1 Tax=Pyronema omphalodes (strain CBS 100304) TaxID=1076935 RepID=U4LH07_PYROM|nr:Protein of unknown function [Pyronema omphalodes CBS 100304]
MLNKLRKQSSTVSSQEGPRYLPKSKKATAVLVGTLRHAACSV